METVTYAPATPEDLARTVEEVEALDQRIYSFTADVRDYEALKSGLDAANWQTMIDINLTGTWHACKAAVPHIIEQGPGGSVILISSTAGLRGIPRYLEVEDVANAVLWLASDESRYVTAVALPVDLGMSMKYSGA